MLNQIPDPNQKHGANIDRESPEEQHRRQHPAHQAKGKEAVDTSRKDQVIGQQTAVVTVLGNVPDIPAYGLIGPDDHVPDGIERGPIFLARTHGVHFWNLYKAVVLQMDGLKGMKIDQIEWAE